MYELTEVYSEYLDSEKQRRTRRILVNPAQVTFIREAGSVRRIYFIPGSGNPEYVDVDESLDRLRAYFGVLVSATQR